MLNLFFSKFLHIPWRILNLDFFFLLKFSTVFIITLLRNPPVPPIDIYFLVWTKYFCSLHVPAKKTIQTVHTVIRSMFYFIVISLTRRRKRKRFGDSVVSDNYKYLNYKYTILLQTQTLTLISLSTFATMFEVSLRFLERF